MSMVNEKSVKIKIVTNNYSLVYFKMQDVHLEDARTAFKTCEQNECHKIVFSGILDK